MGEAEKMNHEDGTGPWFFGQPQAPPWDVIGYNELISAGPLLPLLEQYAGMGTMHEEKVNFSMFVDLKMAFLLMYYNDIVHRFLQHNHATRNTMASCNMGGYR